MRRFRFHLGTLVILVLLVGVGFAALRESNEIWDSSIFSITLSVLLISILAATLQADPVTVVETRSALGVTDLTFGYDVPAAP